MVRFNRSVKCRVCKLKIKTFSKSMGSGNLCPRTSYTDSDEGTQFKIGIWFCNDCWEKIIKKVKIDGVFDGM